MITKSLGIFLSVYLVTAAEIDCSVKFSDLSSSTSSVICPAGCWRQSHSLCGTGTYGDGPVCLAAIHDGVISDCGGFTHVYEIGGSSLSNGSFRYFVTTSTCRSLSKAYSFQSNLKYPTSCSDLMRQNKTSGVHAIYYYPGNIQDAIDVYCDMETDGGGWMVIQRRMDNTTTFYRGWVEYEAGFGMLSGNYWFGKNRKNFVEIFRTANQCLEEGLKRLHELTSTRTYELRVDLEDFNNNTKYAKYTVFGIDSPTTFYCLLLGSYSGDAGDSLAYHKNKPFSTKDRDNDNLARNCASDRSGAWWYGNGQFCFASNLNGVYQWIPKAKWMGIVWNSFASSYSLKKSEMKIRVVS